MMEKHEDILKMARTKEKRDFIRMLVARKLFLEGSFRGRP